MKRLRGIKKEMLAVLRAYPIEFLLMVVTYVTWNYMDLFAESEDSILRLLSALPLAFVLTLWGNGFAAQKGKRALYFIISALAIATSVLLAFLLPITPILYVILPFLLFLYTYGHRENHLFVKGNKIAISALFTSIILTGLLYGLLHLILLSIDALFGWRLYNAFLIHNSVIYYHIVHLILFSFLFILFFYIEKRFQQSKWANKEEGSLFQHIAFNYLLSPALLIYTAILYVYSLKILVKWELPEGNVATMVFCFSLSFLLGYGINTQIKKTPFARFYQYFSWITLPQLILFWIGVCRRIEDYGLTELRVYLVLCGIIMTLTTLFFLFRHTRRFYYIFPMAITLFAVALVPSLAPKVLAVKSQYRFVLEKAEELSLLNENQQLSFEQVAHLDSTHLADLKSLESSISELQYASRDTLRAGTNMKAVTLATEAVETLGIQDEAIDYDLRGVIRVLSNYNWESRRYSIEEEYFKTSGYDAICFPRHYYHREHEDKTVPSYYVNDSAIVELMLYDTIPVRYPIGSYIMDSLTRAGHFHSFNNTRVLPSEKVVKQLGINHYYENDKLFLYNFDLKRDNDSVYVEHITIEAILLKEE